MKSVFKGWHLVLVAAIAVGVGAGFLLNAGEDTVSVGRKARIERRATEKKGARVRPRKAAGTAEVAKSRGERIQERPSFVLDADDDAKMSAEFKALYDALQAAFDDEDKAKVIKLVKKMQNMDEWPDDIPQAVKLAALDAMAWFGASCIPEAIGFLGDSDPEVTASAIEKFEEMLCDFDLGDRAVGNILEQVVKVVHDTDALDSFFMEMNNMRNSVKVKTALAILDSGNPEAIEVLKENLEVIFADADDDVTTRDDVVKYGEEHPDDEDDEDFYGPSKED